MGILQNKVVITGAGSAMAKASAQVFVREGAKVVVSDMSGAEKQTAADLVPCTQRRVVSLPGGARPRHQRPDRVARFLVGGLD
jgi:NAD(P)-dependent dehydrogenase (short-subunit alcohol dehydrogenase family)